MCTVYRTYNTWISVICCYCVLLVPYSAKLSLSLNFILKPSFPSRLSTGLGEDVSHPKVEVVARWVVDQFVPGTGGTSWTSWTGVNGSRC